MTDWVILFTAFSLGLFGSAHCVGMCGGIMGALTLAIPKSAVARRWQLLLSYNLGRIASYAFMGLLLGWFAGAFSSLGGALWLRIIAGLLLIAMGLYLADWWRGLVYIERLGKYLWAYLQPLGKSLMPVSSTPKALLLGMLWGWLPCGLVYSALAYAMAQAQPLLSAAVMLAFGLGTLPAVIATGVAAQQLTRLLQRRYVRTGLALLIIVFGVWTLLGGTHRHGGHHSEGHSGHSHLQESEAPISPPGEAGNEHDHSHH